MLMCENSKFHNVQMQDGKRTITFLAAAITFTIQSTNTEMLLYGNRHSDIIRQIANAGYTSDYKIKHIDGFVCRVATKKYNTITFINREQATQIAKKAKYPMIGSILTSEDLW